MKKNNLRKMAFVLTVALATPTVASTNTSVVFAATSTTTKATTNVTKTKTNTTQQPTLNVTSQIIKGVNKTYTLKVNNMVKGSVCKWISSDIDVATINSAGKITSLAAGTTVVTAQITTPNKKIIKLYCKITVRVIPMTSIIIKNAPTDNILKVGETFDYNLSFTPSNSTDGAKWKIKNTNIATVDKYGVVTARAKGNTILTVTSTSGQTDSVPIIVEQKAAGIDSVVLNHASEIVLHFTDEMDASTLIDSDNTLKNVMFKRRTDKNSVMANDYGTLTATLSTDKKSLTIQSSSIFKGSYELIISKGVKTLAGKDITFDDIYTITDTIKPRLTNVSLDGTGVIATIEFSEPVNTTNFVPSNARRLDGGNLNAASLNVLTNKNNYVLSKDKKSMTIDLSNLSTEDQGKQFSVILVGITDITGNPADNLNFSMQTDVSTRAQAKVVSAIRTGYNTITVCFDSPIKNPGTLQLGSSTNKLVGVKDPNDNKKVTYTLTTNETNLTGNQYIVLSDFSGYNTVSPGVQTATVNFTVTAEAPIVTSSKLVTTSNNGIELNSLVLTYNKNVTLSNTAGTLSATLRTDNDDITSPTIVYTNAVVNGNQVTLTLDNSYVGSAGTYNITLPDGFVKDDFFTYSKSILVSIVKGIGGTSQMPAPTIAQSTTNPNEINVTFQRKVDVVSAENTANYSIPGATVTKAVVTYNTSNGATVKLTIANGTIVANTVYVVTISGIKGANGSYSAMNPSVQSVPLVENVAPYVVSSKINSDLKTIILTFSENIKGTASFSVYQNGVLMPLSTVSQVTVSSNKVTITLNSTLPSVTNVTVVPGANNSITDYNNNMAAIGTLSATY
ncbi:Ig-like domain-containing protein [Anaeromicropila herbilytica]|uniref:BIG2 domain-containing protein n=1 Tax=Anaeromicropila herbilytica TaxID=2785025 RepID=A0A7R7EIJ8_9FIRM|nr:Ig-like domain-containing protein [Anaeromicropila herbilytica]BCN29830.1 hypothetical protein bsdtb5_11250 [Anaeromicropila herbilytica]